MASFPSLGFYSKKIIRDGWYSMKLTKKVGVIFFLGFLFVFFAQDVSVFAKTNIEFVPLTEEEKKLIIAEGDLSIQEKRNLLPSGFAVENVEKDLDLGVKNKGLFRACAYGTASQVQDAIDNGAQINARINNELIKEYGWTPLMVGASYNSNSEVIAILLRAGAMVDARDLDGVTALMDAAAYNTNPDILSLLIKAGADVKAEDKEYKSVLFWAISNPNLGILKTLIENGADVMSRIIGRQTTLIRAVIENSNREVISFLINAGVDVHARDIQDATAIIWAPKGKIPVEAITILIEAGANVNACDRFGQTALMNAVSYSDDIKVIRTLLDIGANASLKNEDGKTAFDLIGGKETLKNTDVYWRLNDARYE